MHEFLASKLVIVSNRFPAPSAFNSVARVYSILRTENCVDPRVELDTLES